MIRLSHLILNVVLNNNVFLLCVILCDRELRHFRSFNLKVKLELLLKVLKLFGESDLGSQSVGLRRGKGVPHKVLRVVVFFLRFACLDCLCTRFGLLLLSSGCHLLRCLCCLNCSFALAPDRSCDGLYQWMINR